MLTNTIVNFDNKNGTDTSDFAKTGSFAANCFISERCFLKSSSEGLTSNLLQKHVRSVSISVQHLPKEQTQQSVPRNVLKNFAKVVPQCFLWLMRLSSEKMQHLRCDQHSPDHLLVAVQGPIETHPTSAFCCEHRKLGLLPLEPQSPGHHLIVHTSPAQHQPLLAVRKIISVPELERQGGEADRLLHVRGVNEVVDLHRVELRVRIVVVRHHHCCRCVLRGLRSATPDFLENHSPHQEARSEKSVTN